MPPTKRVTSRGTSSGAIRRTGSKAPQPRRYGSEYGGYVQKVYGEGPYAVEYGTNTYRRDGPICHAKRFKYLNSAAAFFVKKIEEGQPTAIYLWETRNATRMPSPNARGQYEGLRKTYTSEDYNDYVEMWDDHATLSGLIEEIKFALSTSGRRAASRRR